MEERRREDDQDIGYKGGATEAHIRAGAYPAAETVVSLVRHIRWDVVAAGTFVAIATMMLLTSLGIGLGLSFGVAGPGGGLAYWVIGSAAVGLFVGSMLAAKYANIVSLWSAVTHGIVIWSLFMILDRLGVDLIGGISRFLFAGVATGATSAGAARAAMSDAGWWFFIGYIIALAAAVLGSVAGLGNEEIEERRV